MTREVDNEDAEDRVDEDELDGVEDEDNGSELFVEADDETAAS